MTTRHHRTRLALALGAGVLALAACAPSSSSGDSGGGDSTTLTVWSWRPEDKAAYEKIFAVFEKEHPGITVDFKAFKATEYNQILATGLAGSDGPDVPQVRSYGDLQPTVASGALLPLDDDIDLSSWDANIVAGAQGKEDGKLYAVPLARQATVMFYDKKLFAENGIEVPTTWDQFIAVNETFLKQGITPMAVGAKDEWTLPIVHEVLGGAAVRRHRVPEGRAVGGERLHRPRTGSPRSRCSVTSRSTCPKNVTGVTFTDAHDPVHLGAGGDVPRRRLDLATLQKRQPGPEDRRLPGAAAARFARAVRAPRPPAGPTATSASRRSRRTRRRRPSSSSGWPRRSSARWSPTTSSRSPPSRASPTPTRC